MASGLVEGPLLISITKLLHAVELPILLVAIFRVQQPQLLINVSPPPSIWWASPAPARLSPAYCRRWRAAAMKIWLRPVLSDHGPAGVLHHLYFHLLVALRQILRRSR
ncbi:hypothetical protein LNP74_06850 [Klebsiella pneumoniae subsp. pneumoniae]|nr:hypothetical protein [Klebsiella pneumoniae subsp. pneumoniae]